MPKIKQIILTIHGVNPDRGWQERVRRVLEAHFDCRHLCYKDYDGILGPIKAVFVPGLIPFVILSVALAFFLSGSLVLSILWISLSIALSTLGLWMAWQQRSSVLNRTKVKFDRKLAGHIENPHVIAHSLGTYLIGRIVEKFDEAKFSRVVLVGCVLPRNFPWERILADKNGAFKNVRNEVGLKDWVVLLAGIAGWFTWDIGCAGWRGFSGGKDFIHKIKGAMNPCKKCETLVLRAPVHNIPLKKYLHSDHFLGTRHAQKLWLPFLWSYPPQEYEDYLLLCRDAAYTWQEESWDQQADRETELRTQIWSWTSSTGTLEQHIRRRVIRLLNKTSQPIPGGPELAEMVDDAVFHLFWLVVDAFQESEKEGERNLELIEALHPDTAIGRAVKEALKL